MGKYEGQPICWVLKFDGRDEITADIIKPQMSSRKSERLLRHSVIFTERGGHLWLNERDKNKSINQNTTYDFRFLCISRESKWMSNFHTQSNITRFKGIWINAGEFDELFLVREVILAGLLSNLRRENWARLQESAPGDTLLEISPNFDIHLNIFDSKCVPE